MAKMGRLLVALKHLSCSKEVFVLKQQPTLHTLHKGSLVRHLLIEGDDNAAKTLSILEKGVRTVVDTGTHYEMDQKAMALIQEWCREEGFRWRSDDAPVWESLPEIVILAKLMGHSSLFESTRMFGYAVPLDAWPGCRDKFGDDYGYWYRGTTIEACPKVTAKHGINLNPATNEEFLVEMRKGIEIRKALGPERKFFLD